MVLPSVSILAEPPVAVIDAVVDRHGTRAAAEAYVQYLYSAAGQEIAGKHHFRPYLREVARKYDAKFKEIPMFSVDEVFGSWKQAQETHFSDNGIFDQIYTPGR